MFTRLQNRKEAGRLLAEKLTKWTDNPNVLVLALPRGGVPVGFEIAKILGVPLDLCLVRKLGVPRHKELAMGAIALNRVMVLNQDVIESLNVTPEMLTEVIKEEDQELQRRDRLYRGDRPFPQLKDQIIILVDDGIATGATLRAGIKAIKQEQPKQIIVAVPVVPCETYDQLKQEIDQFIALLIPEFFHSLSLWYDDFSQTTDLEVRELLEKANSSSIACSDIYLTV
jgi:predicted phosphoribosyltransferase